MLIKLAFTPEEDWITVGNLDFKRIIESIEGLNTIDRRIQLLDRRIREQRRVPVMLFTRLAQSLH
jgi:hypothetical protein